MWKPPANVQETTAQLIDAGIAQRMLIGSHQSHLPSDPSGCLFWVEVDEGPQGETETISVIVQFPPHAHMQSFPAMPGETFGIYGQPPLSKEQQALVNRLAEVRK